MSYLVSSYWRGAMNVGDMRLKDTEEEAWDYAKTLEGYPSPHRIRVYLVSKTDPPRLLKFLNPAYVRSQLIKENE